MSTETFITVGCIFIWLIGFATGVVLTVPVRKAHAADRVERYRRERIKDLYGNRGDNDDAS